MKRSFVSVSRSWLIFGVVVSLTPWLVQCSRSMLPAPTSSNTSDQANTVVAQEPVDPGDLRPKEKITRAPEAALTVYKQRCALCHGAHGKGDGVAAVNLRPQPRSFADKLWQDATTDEAIQTIVVRGGGAVGKSMMMPPAQDLAGNTETLQGLVAVIRGFGPAQP